MLDKRSLSACSTHTTITCLGSFSSSQGICHHTRRCCSLGFGGWWTLVERATLGAHHPPALPALRLCPKPVLCHASAGSGPWHICPIQQSQAQLCRALWGVFVAVSAAPQRWCDAHLPCVQDQRRLRGTARVWGLFSQRYYKFLQCEPLMFSKTQAERTC